MIGTFHLEKIKEEMNGSICFKESLVKTKQVSFYILCLLIMLMRVSQNRSVHLIGCCDQNPTY